MSYLHEELCLDDDETIILVRDMGDYYEVTVRNEEGDEWTEEADK